MTVHAEPRKKGKSPRGHPRGRPVAPQALIEVRDLLGDEPRRRDLLIEHLHKIQDRYGNISAAHIAALAFEMKLAPTEVYKAALVPGAKCTGINEIWMRP